MELRLRHASNAEDLKGKVFAISYWRRGLEAHCILAQHIKSGAYPSLFAACSIADSNKRFPFTAGFTERDFQPRIYQNMELHDVNRHTLQ